MYKVIRKIPRKHRTLQETETLYQIYEEVQKFHASPNRSKVVVLKYINFLFIHCIFNYTGCLKIVSILRKL